MFDLATEQNRPSTSKSKKKKLKKSREQNKQRPTVRATATVRGWIVGPAVRLKVSELGTMERGTGGELWKRRGE